MHTSAQALSEVLAELSRSNRNNDQFGEVLADLLGIESGDRIDDALFWLRRLGLRVEKDILSLDVDGASKKHLRQLYSPFRSMVNFAQTNSTLDAAKKGFMQPNNLLNLVNIQLALNGNINLADLDFDVKSVTDEFREIRERVNKLNIDDKVKNYVMICLSQLISSLENYRFFGSEGLDSAVKGLVGALVLHSPEIKEKENDSVFKSLREKLSYLVGVLKETNSGVKAIGDMSSTIPKIAENAQDFIDKM